MKYKVIIEIEGPKPSEKEIAELREQTEEAALDALHYEAQYINTFITSNE